MSHSSFLLTKWYLDCVADNGDTVVLYVADLRWNRISLHYGSILTAIRDEIGSASSLHGSVAPAVDGGMISVKQPRLGMEGIWTALRPPARRTVFETADGLVDWHCLQPMSQVDLVLRGGIRITGLGYAECLTLSLLPWQLPLTELNWGRYLSREDAIVWIDWKSTKGRRIAIHNGEERLASSITESEVAFNGSEARLELDRGRVLREGRLGDTVFPTISRLIGLLPRSILAVNECKWRSRGRLHTRSGDSSGWVIHEVVKWKS